jgi:small subunit ribosomal protein S16
MAVKIRLQRHGKKDAAFFHVVAADGRAPRDGAFIEKLGTYNPNTNPATIELNFESTLKWLQNGAVPTETCNAILSYKGILMKKHLLDGVKKGALTEAQVEERFAKWLEQKENKINSKKDNLSSSAKKAIADKFKAETASKEAKAAKIAAKTAVVEAAATSEAEAPAADAPSENTEA